MTSARRTRTTAVALAFCTGLLGLVLGFSGGAWWGHRERVWYVDVLIHPEGEHAPCSTTPTLRRLVPPPLPY